MPKGEIEKFQLQDGAACPVSGLPVDTTPDWHLDSDASTYRIRFFRIGDQILLRHTSGKANGRDAERGCRLHQQIETQMVKKTSHYVQIEDFSDLDGFNLAARRVYIQHFESRPHLRGLIFFGVTPLMAVNIRVAMKLYRVKFPIKVANSYNDAIALALDILTAGDLQELSDAPSAPSASGQYPHAPMDTISNPDWSIIDEGYQADYKIIDGRIIWADVKGVFQHQHIVPTLEMQERLFLKLDADRDDYFMIADVTDLEGISFRVRLEYIKAQNQFYNSHPFQGLIFCSTSPIIRAAIHLGRPVAKFPVLIAKDKETCLRMTTLQSTEADCNGKPGDTHQPAALKDVEAYVADVLDYLGHFSIRTESKEYQPIQFPPGHPFGPVFEAIDLVYDDINELLGRSVEGAKERLELQKKLALAQKMEAIGLLAGGVAHDLNNVLSGITTYPQALLLGMPHNHPMRQALQTIQDSGNKAAAIVQDLLTLTRRGNNVFKVLNFNHLIEEYFTSSEHKALCDTYPDLKIETDLNPDLPYIKGSPVHLVKTLMNLIINGVEAQEQGPECYISIKTDHCFVDTTRKGVMDIPAGEFVLLSVTDQGVGIEPQHLGRIFEPFYTRKQMGRSGTGLGMTVIWGTVQDHHAYLDIESTVGRGTTFHIYFPVCREALSEKDQVVTQEQLRQFAGNGQTILVIDDVPTQREIAAAILTRLGYRVSTAASGEEAVEYLKDNHAELLILDMEMAPGKDGYETYQEIGTFKPGQRVIIVSGFTESEKIKKLQSIGVDQFLKKPYTIEMLAKTAHQVLNHP